jgi:hypothetical protein
VFPTTCLLAAAAAAAAVDLRSFSMCEWGVAGPWHWAPSVGNSWRTDADIAPFWDSVLRCLDNGAAGLAKFAGPGGWNDPDMLEVRCHSYYMSHVT